MPIVIILQMSKQSPRGLSHFVRIHLEMLERAEAPLTSEAHPLCHQMCFLILPGSAGPW